MRSSTTSFDYIDINRSLFSCIVTSLMQMCVDFLFCLFGLVLFGADASFVFFLPQGTR